MKNKCTSWAIRLTFLRLTKLQKELYKFLENSNKTTKQTLPDIDLIYNIGDADEILGDYISFY